MCVTDENLMLVTSESLVLVILQAVRELDQDRWRGWRQMEDRPSCWSSSGLSGSPDRGTTKQKQGAREQSDLKGPVDLLKTSWWRMCYWSTVWLFYCITISKWFLLFVHITSSSRAPDWANVDPLNTIGPCCGLTSLSLSAEDSRESHSSRRWTLPDGTSLRLNHCLQKTHIKTHIFLIWLISLSPDELAG